MDATALRATTHAGGTSTTTAVTTTNGPSSSAPTSGGGPVPAPTQPALLGEHLLPAPVGEPQTINLPDGSTLVPVARVDASGNRVPLTGGAGSAPMIPGGTGLVAGGAAASPASTTGGGATAHVAEGAVVSGDGRVDAAGREFEPLSFLYNGNYYKQYFEDGGINVADRGQVEERASESTYMYLLDKEPAVDDFGITGITTRRVDPGSDRDLLNVNPNAYWIVEVSGVQGNGVQRMIPTVMNEDGATFTDPRLSKG
jgi:hypothetical protein